MDPVETLRLLREMSSRIRSDDVDPREQIELSLLMAELFSALDEWRSGGGFDPWEAIV